MFNIEHMIKTSHHSLATDTLLPIKQESWLCGVISNTSAFPDNLGNGVLREICGMLACVLRGASLHKVGDSEGKTLSSEM